LVEIGKNGVIKELATLKGCETPSDNFGRKAPCSRSVFNAMTELVIEQQSVFSILQHRGSDSS
jgi:hypothetical protein